MSYSVDNNKIDTATLNSVIQQLLEASEETGSSTTQTVPSASSAAYAQIAEETVELAAPSSKYSSSNYINLSLLSTDAIMSMLGYEERQSAVDSGLSAIETRRQERAEANQEIIDNLKEQIEKKDNQSIWDKIKSAFQVIGAVLGMIAGAVAVVATGCNPVAIAGLVLLTFAAVDQIASVASDGEISISAGLGELAKAIGGNETAAKIVGTVISAVIGVAGAICSAGASSSSAISSSITQIAKTATSVSSGLVSLASGTATIASGVISSQITNLQADMKELQAILERIQLAGELDDEQLKDIIEKAQYMTESVMDIIEQSNATLSSVVTGGAVSA